MVLGSSWFGSFCILSFGFAFLGLLGSFLGALGVFLGLWGRFWASCGVLGRSLAVLEALEAVLGRVDAPEGSAQKSLAYLDRFLAPSWAPKGTQDGGQDETWRPQDDPTDG